MHCVVQLGGGARGRAAQVAMCIGGDAAGGLRLTRTPEGDESLDQRIAEAAFDIGLLHNHIV